MAAPVHDNHTNEEDASFGPPTPWRRWVPPLASIAYAAALSVSLEGARDPLTWVAGAASLVVGIASVRKKARVARVLGWGAAMVLASLGPGGESRMLSLCGVAGALACAAAAITAVGAIPSSGGIVRVAPSSPRNWTLVVGALWSVALVARVAPPSPALGWMTEHPVLWTVLSAAASALALLARAEWTLRRRGLDLGVVERVLAMRALLGALAATVLVIGLLGHAQADSLARLAVVVASVIIARAALHPDAVGVARIARRVVVLTMAGGAVALLGASAVDGGGTDVWSVVVVTVAVAVAVGACAAALEAPLRPERGRWLEAFAHASAESTRAEPDDVIREVLRALREPGGLSSPAPELWTFTPPCATKVDAAGYVHERPVDLSEALVVTAAAEPEGTLRAEVLDSLEVRRPELRPFSKWMADHGASLATVVSYDGDSEGLLLLPRVHRAQPPTLEELRALKRVADGLAAACRARAVQARLLAQATTANRRAELAEERSERLLHERLLCVGRDVLAATRLARPAAVGGYAVASRMALEALERRAARGAPIAVVAASGVDPVPYLARAHLAGARGAGPLVLVDATSAREHELERWSDPLSSPLALADRGTLVLLDGAALPPDVQQLIARALAEKRAPWERPEPLDVQFAFSAVAGPDQLTRGGRLDPSLALRLADACERPIVLPRLRDRVEDLRAVITNRLACEGLRVLGRPVGIERAACARLVEHLFPGEEAELAVLVQRLVSLCSGDVVRAADVDALRLPGHAASGPRPATGRRKSPLSA